MAINQLLHPLQSLQLLQSLQFQCHSRGFDLCHPFHTAWYNSLLEEEELVQSGTLERLPEPFGILGVPTVNGVNGVNGCYGDNGCNAILIGNTKSIWPHFLNWLAAGVKARVGAKGKAKGKAKGEAKVEAKGKANTNSHTNAHAEAPLTNKTDEQDDEKILDEILSQNPFDTFVKETLVDIVHSCCCEFMEKLKNERLTGGDQEDQDRKVQKEQKGQKVQTSKMPSMSFDFFWSNGKRQTFKVTGHGSRNQRLSNGEATENYHCCIDTENGKQATEAPEVTEPTNITESTSLTVAPEAMGVTRAPSSSSSSSFLVSMQRVAKLTGLYWHDDEATKLCVHPQYGTWMAFRAVVVFDAFDAFDDAFDFVDGAPDASDVLNVFDSESQQSQQSTSEVSKTLTTSKTTKTFAAFTPPPPPPLAMCQCPVAQHELQRAKQIMDYALGKTTAPINEINEIKDTSYNGGGKGQGSGYSGYNGGYYASFVDRKISDPDVISRVLHDKNTDSQENQVNEENEEHEKNVENKKNVENEPTNNSDDSDEPNSFDQMPTTLNTGNKSETLNTFNTSNTSNTSIDVNKLNSLHSIVYLLNQRNQQIQLSQLSQLNLGGSNGSTVNYRSHDNYNNCNNYDDIPETLRPWIQMRDCISIGREEWKYSDEMLLYHYLKDSSILKRELDRWRKRKESK